MRCVSKLSESDRPRRRRKVRQGRGFTLIELMVAIAIIALLIGLLIPAIKSVRNAAKDADTQALFQTLTQGNEQFRANQQIGGSYVPSTTDSTANQQDYTGIFGFMANPFESISGFSSAIFANGANLLVYGLAGADGLGTPGFVDIERTERTWCEDQHDREAAGNTPAGAYALDRTGGTLEPLHPRHGPSSPTRPLTGSTPSSN